jgi:hypothetical protein
MGGRRLEIGFATRRRARDLGRLDLRCLPQFAPGGLSEFESLSQTSDNIEKYL